MKIQLSLICKVAHGHDGSLAQGLVFRHGFLVVLYPKVLRGCPFLHSWGIRE